MSENNQKYKFDGFKAPNYTPVPDEVFDELMDILSNAELKVLLYIIRRTFGFKKAKDNIAFSQLCNGIVTKNGEVLDKGTGLSKSSVALAVKSLAEKNIIVIQRNVSKQRGFEPTTYSLNILSTPLSENRTSHPLKIGQALSGLPDIQETDVQEINVNVEFVKKEEKNDDDNDNVLGDVEANLLNQIIEYTGDTNPKSVGTFLRIIRKLRHGTFDRMMATLKDAVRSGKTTKKKSAAYFIGIAKNIAKERGIELGFEYKENKKVLMEIEEMKAKIGNFSTIKSLRSNQ